jgi:hypothetical protein
VSRPHQGLLVTAPLSHYGFAQRAGRIENTMAPNYLLQTLVTLRGRRYSSLMASGSEFSNLQTWLRKVAATAALFALLLPGLSALGGNLSASDLPPCCNTSYCPLHHRDASSLQRDRKNCDSTGSPATNDCSMRACDAVAHSVVGPALYLLVTTLAIRGLSPAECTFSFVFPAIPHVSPFPLTPPPRTFLS